MRKDRDITGLKPSVCVRVGPDPWAGLPVDPALGPVSPNCKMSLMNLQMVGQDETQDLW